MPISNSACPICWNAWKPPPITARGNLGRVEDGLQDILRHLETQHANFAALAENSRQRRPQPADSGLVDLVKRELSDIRFSQSETDRHTQDSLEAVHNTLGHVVDRLAMIEGDLRTVRAPPLRRSRAPPAPPPHRRRPPRRASRCRRSQSRNCRIPPRHRSISPPRRANSTPRSAAPAAAVVTPRAISEILEPHAAAPRAAIEPDLPPDHPLEPGTRPTGAAGLAVGADRRFRKRHQRNSGRHAPNRSAPRISSPPRAAPRRPPQPRRRPTRPPAQLASPRPPPRDDAAKEPSTITSKIRSLLVGASVVVIVLGTFKMAMTLLDSGSAPQLPAMENSSEPPPPAQSPAADDAKPAMPAPAMPSMTSPTPIGKQSLNSSAPDPLDSSASAAIPQARGSALRRSGLRQRRHRHNSGGAGTGQPQTDAGQVPPTERLPDAIGGPVLRAAALKGDPAAAYRDRRALRRRQRRRCRISTRPRNGMTARRRPAWCRRSSGSARFYEKGLSVKKDVDIARRYYMQAAERGNAKAMHNLAVLDADGGGKGANYKSAAQWFRKAADRGVADSQFNLGILYARGIGVEQNLAESFKWFSLAAAQGDADSVRKRDDIAKRLDAQSLAAAKLAIQTFTPEPQPDDAINVASPGRRMGPRAGAGRHRQARGQAGLDQARRAVNLSLFTTSEVARRTARRKSRCSRIL